MLPPSSGSDPLAGVLEFLGVDKAETKEANAKANPCGLSTEPVYMATTHAMIRSQPLDARARPIRSDAAFVAQHPYGPQNHRDFIVSDRAQVYHEYLVTFRG